MELFLLFLFGICIGSFLNVLIDRLPREEKILVSRSYCENCKRRLQWFDLFPLISYLLLLGKCRYCNETIPFRIFLVELTTGLLFVVLDIALSPFLFPFLFLLYAVVICCLLVIFFVDLDQGIIPDLMLAVVLLATVVLRLRSNHSGEVMPYLLTGMGSFLFFLAIYVATKGKGMGFGDVKFAFVIGFFLGFPKTLIALYIAFLTGAIFSLILVIIGKKKFHGGTIPFGPFLVVGVMAAFFLGEKIAGIFPFF